MVTAIKKINRVLSLLESEESREKENILQSGDIYADIWKTMKSVKKRADVRAFNQKQKKAKVSMRKKVKSVSRSVVSKSLQPQKLF